MGFFEEIEGVIITALLVACVVGGFFLWERGNSYKKDLEAKTSQYEQVMQDNGRLQQSVLSDQSILDTLKKRGDDLQGELNNAAVNINQLNTQNASLVGNIRQAKVPTDCPAAVKWGATEAQALSKQWGVN